MSIVREVNLNDQTFKKDCHDFPVYHHKQRCRKTTAHLDHFHSNGDT